jgi:hypothetical protein
MNLQRLKFAYARGARIQLDYVALGYMGRTFRRTAQDDGWRDVDQPAAWETYAPFWRIHPEDEHLQYGPLSKALRERVLNAHQFYYPIASAACSVAAEWFDLKREWWDLDGNDRQMAYLFLAEALADEGL